MSDPFHILAPRKLPPAEARRRAMTATVYATDGDPFRGPVEVPNRLAEIELGGLAARYAVARAQMPQLVAYERALDPNGLFLRNESIGDPLGAYALRGLDVMVFTLPYGSFAVALLVEIETDDRGGRVQFLRDASFRKCDVKLGGLPLCKAVAEWLPAALGGVIAEHEPGLVHQIFRECDVRSYARAASDPHDLPDVDAIGPGDQFALDRDYVDAVIHHSFDPLRQAFSRVRFPREANHELGFFTAVTNSTTVIGGDESDIENAMLLAAVQGVASASRAADIRARAYRELSTLTRETAAGGTTPHSRARLADLSTQLSALRLDLAFGVEAYKDVTLVLPHFRIAGYHRALVEMMRIPDGAETIRALLGQLSEASAAALTAVEREERDADEAARAKQENRSRVVTGVATVLGAVAVPLTLVFAFLGVNASEVDGSRSILSLSHYWPWYALIAVLCLAAFALSWAPETLRRRRALRGQPAGESSAPSP